MKRFLPILGVLCVAALSPAPIKDTRPLVVQPEMREADRERQMQGARMSEVGSVPADTERLAVPSIEGNDDASGVIRQAGEQSEASNSARKGAAAIQEASREIAQRDKPNWGRIFAGGLIVVAAFGLFQVFRMWANKSLPDAPASFR